MKSYEDDRPERNRDVLGADAWQIIDSVPAFVWCARPDGSIKFLNQRGLAYTGFSLAQIKGQNWEDTNILHPDDMQALFQTWSAIVASGQDGEIQARMKRFDGEYKWFLFRVAPLKDHAGRLVGWLGIDVAIDESKHGEEEMRKFASLIENSTDFIGFASLEGQVRFINATGRSMVGLAEHEQVRKTKIPDYIAEQDLERFNREVLPAVFKDGRWEGETLFRNFKTGESIPMWQHVFFITEEGSGRSIALATICRDITERKRAEEALRASELNFRTIVESIPGMVGTMTATGELEYANRQVLTFLGTTLEALRDWAKYVHPEDRARVVRLYTEAIQTGLPLDFECRVQRVDGVYRWLHYRGQTHRDSDGRVTRRYFLQTDIEDLKQAEEEARANELKFRLTIDNIPGMAFTCTSAGELEFVNRRVMEFFGKTLDELKDWSSFVHPEDRSRLVAEWTHSVETGQALDEELRLLRADGVYRWAHSRHLPFWDADGHVIRWYCLIIDVEDRKRAEGALRASENDLALIIETMPGLVWCADLDGNITYVNQRILTHMGTTFEAVKNGGWVNFLHPDDVELVARAWSHSVATGEPYGLPARLRRFNGEYLWFQCLGHLGRDDKGHPTRWFGLLVDINSMKLVEDALRNTQSKLARATQIATGSELSASLAHEMNQPLAAVVTNGHACLQWLSARPPNIDMAREAADRIIRDATEAGEVANRVRALFRQVAPEKIRLNLNEIVGEVIRLLEGETKRRRILVEVDLEDHLPAVMGDRVQLQQLLFNLLLNGMEAIDESTHRPGQLCVRSRRANDMTVIVEVKDSGIGLENTTNIFDAFFTTKENGMGMGLAISRSIVESHGGRLWAESKVGFGATFSFALPARSSVRQ